MATWVYDISNNSIFIFYLKAKNFNNIKVTGIPIIAAKQYAINLCNPKILKVIITTMF